MGTGVGLDHKREGLISPSSQRWFLCNRQSYTDLPCALRVLGDTRTLMHGFLGL